MPVGIWNRDFEHHFPTQMFKFNFSRTKPIERNCSPEKKFLNMNFFKKSFLLMNFFGAPCLIPVFRLNKRWMDKIGVILVCLALILRSSSIKVLSLITFIIRVFLHWSYCSPCSSRAQKCIIVTNRHHLEKWGRPESELLEISETSEISEIFEFSIKWFWLYGYSS